MPANQNITEKNYRKLSIQVSLGGFKFCCFDTLNNIVLSVREIDFNDFEKASKAEHHYWQAFVSHRELTAAYDEVVVVHENNLAALVPDALFDENCLGSYLQYNTKVFESDFFAYDRLEPFGMVNVYIPYANFNNYLLDQFDSFEYFHINSILVPKILEISRNLVGMHLFVHVAKDHFEIAAVEGQKLLLFNSFEYQTKEDFIYYILFAAEQLKANPELFKLQLFGAVSEESELFKIAYKYIRNVSLLDVFDTQKHNKFSAGENLKHFILFNS
ncbi:MAG TPA: DUF3822 family protein [Flavobacterium sp.]|nr:DUF3822 family protein [Flavobacterium sp.]